MIHFVKLHKFRVTSDFFPQEFDARVCQSIIQNDIIRYIDKYIIDYNVKYLIILVDIRKVCNQLACIFQSFQTKF